MVDKIAGGVGLTLPTTAERYDPVSGTWAEAGALATARSRHTATALPDGYVLVSRRHIRSKNSWMHNVKVLVKGKDRCTLIVQADPAEGALPGQWRLLWLADSSGVNFVETDSLTACSADTAR